MFCSINTFLASIVILLLASWLKISPVLVGFAAFFYVYKMCIVFHGMCFITVCITFIIRYVSEGRLSVQWKNEFTKKRAARKLVQWYSATEQESKFLRLLENKSYKPQNCELRSQNVNTQTFFHVAHLKLISITQL